MGGWLSNDKYADIGYMKKTAVKIVGSGIALASIDYRFSTQSLFLNKYKTAIGLFHFYYDSADKYGFDRRWFSLIGFSADAHFASLMGLSKNDNAKDFFMPGTSSSFGFKGVVDFYGTSELILFPGNNDAKSPESILIGATPLARPDSVKTANPVSYVDENVPPFLIIHGEKDELGSPSNPNN